MSEHERLEQEIDQALHALRAIQPMPGLEQRVTAKLRQRTAVSAGRGTRRWLLALTMYGFAIAGFLLALSSWHRAILPHKASSPNTAASTPHSAPSNLASMAQQSSILANPARERRRTTPAEVHPAADGSGAASTPQVAASFLPSMAPPPPELTAQERLLVRMAQVGNPQELRRLDPSLRAELNAADRASFDQFFPQRPVPAPASANVVLPPLVSPAPSLPLLDPPPITPPTREGDAR